MVSPSRAGISFLRDLTASMSRIVQPLGKRKVLVVDDEHLIAFSLSAYLETMNFDVVWTLSSTEALSLIRERAFDIMITDVFLEHMTGLELVTELRKRDRNCKIVLMSAILEWTKIEKELAHLDVQAFLEKPFELSVVYETLKELTNETSI